MARRQSAGLLLYRRKGKLWEFYLGHPGGPFYRRRDDGWWSIPKGTVEQDEDPVETAHREFLEETGFDPPVDGWMDLGPIRQKGGKVVHAWAVEWRYDSEPPELNSYPFEMEWPPKSGKRVIFYEFDKAGFLAEEEARRKINEAQREFLDRLIAYLEEGVVPPQELPSRKPSNSKA